MVACKLAQTFGVQMRTTTLQAANIAGFGRYKQHFHVFFAKSLDVDGEVCGTGEVMLPSIESLGIPGHWRDSIGTSSQNLSCQWVRPRQRTLVSQTRRKSTSRDEDVQTRRTLVSNRSHRNEKNGSIGLEIVK